MIYISDFIYSSFQEQKKLELSSKIFRQNMILTTVAAGVSLVAWGLEKATQSIITALRTHQTPERSPSYNAFITRIEGSHRCFQQAKIVALATTFAGLMACSYQILLAKNHPLEGAPQELTKSIHKLDLDPIGQVPPPT